VIRGNPNTAAMWCGVTATKKGGPEEPPALTFANVPQKHAYVDCDNGDRLAFIISSLR